MEFEQYMRAAINEEKAKIEADATYENQEARGNLLTAMLKVSASAAKHDGGGKKTTFTDDEVLGNAFMFFLAGTYVPSMRTPALDRIIQAMTPQPTR